MKRVIIFLFTIISFLSLNGQDYLSLKVNPVEYNLKNGLHVIICQDTTSPIINVGVMYHVGSKNENPNRTGFAHLFEHLLFNGTKNIPEGEMENYMRAAGGYANANTTADRTYYYTILPSNQLKLGLWIESERMLHPILSERVISREKEVVKEESRQRYDMNPLGRVPEKMQAFEYIDFPYKWPVIGSMKHLDQASISDFKEFSNKFYVPNNACLVITGDVDIKEVKEYVNAYFNRIPKGKAVIQPEYNESFISGEILLDTLPGIKEPHMVVSYRTVPETHKDATILTFLNSHLTFNDSSPLTQISKLNNGIIKVSSTTEMYEKAGSFWVRCSYKDSIGHQVVLDELDSLFEDIGENGLDSIRISQLKLSYISGYADMFFDMPFLAEMLAISHLEWGSAQRVNTLISEFNDVSNEDVKRVAKKYFIPENRKSMIIYPKK